MQQGKFEEKIREQARLTGNKLPPSIQNKPQLTIGLDLYWKAFVDLSADREIGMAEGPIPWSAVHLWAQRRGIHGDDFERLWFIIHDMDVVYMEHQGKEAKKGSAKTKRAANKAKSIRSKR